MLPKTKTLKEVQQEIFDLKDEYDYVMLAKGYTQDEYIDGWFDTVRKYEEKNHCKIKFRFLSSDEVFDVTYDV